MAQAALPRAPGARAPAPFGLDDEANGAGNFVSTNRHDYTERDLAAAYVPRVKPAERPLPYSHDALRPQDALDRFVTTSAAQFVSRDVTEARIGQPVAWSRHGRPLPYALDDGADGPGRYETTSRSQFLTNDLSQARVAAASHSNYHGRPLPYASDPQLDEADKWLSASKRHFVERDLVGARPARAVFSDHTYSVVTLEPIPTFPSAAERAARGRSTAELGVTRPDGIDPVPMSRKTEQHFIQSVDTFKPMPGVGRSYASAELLRSDVGKHALERDPAQKHTQPVTESQCIGWRWSALHDGYDAVPERAPSAERAPGAPPPAREPYHGRKASHFTRHKESLLLAGRTAFSGAVLAQSGPSRHIL